MKYIYHSKNILDNESLEKLTEDLNYTISKFNQKIKDSPSEDKQFLLGKKAAYLEIIQTIKDSMGIRDVLRKFVNKRR